MRGHRMQQYSSLVCNYAKQGERFVKYGDSLLYYHFVNYRG